jgi:hypothetical protein
VHLELRATAKSGLEQARVQVVVTRLQDIGNRRGLDEVVEIERRGAAQQIVEPRPAGGLQLLSLVAARDSQPHRRCSTLRAVPNNTTCWIVVSGNPIAPKTTPVSGAA